MLEIICGSTCVVLLLSTGLFVSLLCLLGDFDAWRKLTRSLQSLLLGSTKAVLRLGGLLPVELFCDLQKSDNQEIILEHKVERVNAIQESLVSGTTSAESRNDENYGNVLGYETHMKPTC